MGVGCQRHAPAALPPGKTSARCVGSWVGSRAVWTGAENLASTGIRSLTVQPLAGRYTDWTIPAH